MPTFRYQTAGGEARTIEASDRSQALRHIMEQGFAPTGLEELGKRAARRAGEMTSTGSSGRAKRASRAEMHSFIAELSIALQAGLPLSTALRTIGEQGKSESRRGMIDALLGSVEHGSSLSDAMRSYGKPFPDLVIALVEAGEQAGRLELVLEQASELLERDSALRRSVRGALTYPAILVCLISVAIVVVVTVIVPRVLASVEGQLATLPLPTRIVQGTADFFIGWWWAVLLGVGIAIVAWRKIYADPQARLAIDGFILKIPVLGRLLQDVAVARFARTLGTLTAAGLPVLGALRITRAVLGNKAIEKGTAEVIDKVAGGETIAEPMKASGLFPPLIVQIVGVGERTGKLDEMLVRSASALETKVESSVELFKAVLPPLLIMVMAAVVGLIILAVVLPLLEMQDAIGA